MCEKVKYDWSCNKVSKRKNQERGDTGKADENNALGSLGYNQWPIYSNESGRKIKVMF